MKTGNPHVVHLRFADSDPRNKSGISCFGGLTIAVADYPGGGSRYAVARCHENEHFVKRVGHAKAVGRLNATSPDNVRYVGYSHLAAEQLIDRIASVHPSELRYALGLDVLPSR